MFIIFTIVFLFAGVTGFTQTTVSPSGEIADREVVVVKDRINTLGYAEPILEKAETQPVNEQTREFSYSINPVTLDLPAVKPTVSVQKLETPKIPKLYPNYLRAGGGNHFSSLLEGYFHNGRSKTHSFGAQVKHLASKPKTDTNAFYPRPFSDNSIRLFGKKFMDEITFGAEAGYERNYVNMVMPKMIEIFYRKVDVFKKPIHHTFDSKVFFYTTNIEIPFRSKAEINFYRYLNEFNAEENDLTFKAFLKYKINSSSSIFGNFYASTTDQKNEEKLYRSLSYFAFEPFFWYKKEKAEAKLGLKIHHESIKPVNSDNTGIYPDVSLKYAIVEERLSLFTMADGGKEKTTLKGLVLKNPLMYYNFLANDSTSGNPDLTYKVSGGVEGNLTTTLDIRFGYEFGKYEKNYFFYPTNFALQYYIIEVKNISVKRFFGEAVYRYNDALRILLNAKTNVYDMNKQEEKPWRVPELEAAFAIFYVIKTKIEIHSEISLLNNYFLSEKDRNGNFEKKSLMDFNLGVDYRFSQRFSLFATAYNLMNEKYSRFYNYPVNGFTIIGGLSFSF